MLALLLTHLVSRQPLLMPDGFTEAIAVAGNGEAIPFPTPGTSIRVPAGRIPAGMVYVSGFAIGKFEVTNAEYGAFVEATGHPVPKCWAGGLFPAGRDNYAVQIDSDLDARAYVRWVARSTGWRLALPTTKQLKLAAKGAPTAEAAESSVGSNPASRSIYGAYDLPGTGAKRTFRMVALPPFAPSVP